uniref:Uncharacterized protein n=1 Tax=Pyramimonas orientalis virus TaxID=455367 RepID=A0A7M3UPC2_POV01|nr:hypothetical protein HWQ62_00472 [Pyramimonas orientalis virus]
MACTLYHTTGFMNVTSSHDLHIACFLDAVRDGNEEAVTTLLRLYNIDINDTSHYEAYFATPLMLAVQVNNVSMVRLVLNLGGDANICDYYDRTPLYVAINRQCDISIIQMLLEAGADLYVPVPVMPPDMSRTPLAEAERQGYPDVLSLVRRYTKGYRRWRQMKILALFIGKLMVQYRKSVVNVWQPGGVGYHCAHDDFQREAYQDTKTPS